MKLKNKFFLVGLLFIIVPVVWAGLMRNYEFYLWVINGPYPFSHMGSAPRMLFVDLLFFILALIFFVLGWLLSIKKKN